MLPTFKPNSYVVCLKSKRIRVNDVVVLEDKKIGKVLKRVKSFNDDKVTLKGDNNSYNSTVYETLYNASDIVGKVIFKLW